MSTVNMLEAKAHLSRLVDAVESGADSEIIIARNGRPAAKLLPVKDGEKAKIPQIAPRPIVFAVPEKPCKVRRC